MAIKWRDGGQDKDVRIVKYEYGPNPSFVYIIENDQGQIYWARPYTYLPTWTSIQGVAALECYRIASIEPSVTSFSLPITSGSSIYFKDQLYWHPILETGYKLDSMRFGDSQHPYLLGDKLGDQPAWTQNLNDLLRIEVSFEEFNYHIGTLPSGTGTNIICYRYNSNTSNWETVSNGGLLYYNDKVYFNATSTSYDITNPYNSTSNYLVVTSDVTATDYISFTPKTFNISYSESNVDRNSGSFPATYTYSPNNQNVSIGTWAAKTGYAQPTVTANNGCTYAAGTLQIPGDTRYAITVTAVATVVNYTISYTTTNCTISNNKPTTYNIESNSETTVTITSDEGYIVPQVTCSTGAAEIIGASGNNWIIRLKPGYTGNITITAAAERLSCAYELGSKAHLSSTTQTMVKRYDSNAWRDISITSNPNILYYGDRVYWIPVADTGYIASATYDSENNSLHITDTSAKIVGANYITVSPKTYNYITGVLPTGIASLTAHYSDGSTIPPGTAVPYGTYVYWTATASTGYNTPSIRYTDASHAWMVGSDPSATSFNGVTISEVSTTPVTCTISYSESHVSRYSGGAFPTTYTYSPSQQTGIDIGYWYEETGYKDLSIQVSGGSYSDGKLTINAGALSVSFTVSATIRTYNYIPGVVPHGVSSFTAYYSNGSVLQPNTAVPYGTYVYWAATPQNGYNCGLTHDSSNWWKVGTTVGATSFNGVSVSGLWVTPNSYEIKYSMKGMQHNGTNFETGYTVSSGSQTKSAGLFSPLSGYDAGTPTVDKGCQIGWVNTQYNITIPADTYGDITVTCNGIEKESVTVTYKYANPNIHYEWTSYTGVRPQQIAGNAGTTATKPATESTSTSENEFVSYNYNRAATITWNDGTTSNFTPPSSGTMTIYK